MKQDINIAIELRAHIARRYRTQGNAAKAWNVSPQFVSRVLQGISQPTQVMLNDAGFKRVEEPARIHYVKAKP